MITRRTFSRGAALAAVAALGRPAATRTSTAPRGSLDFGLQLYTLQRQARTDLPGTLNAVAAIGFKSVELPGFLGFRPEFLVASIREAGLYCDTCHLWPSPDRGDPDLDGDVGRTADRLRNLGLCQVVMPFIRLPARLPARRPNEAFSPFLSRIISELTPDDWATNADWMNRRAAALTRFGIGFSYHNHNLEFAPLSRGGSGMELLLANTDPALVSFELDAGWCAAAGEDPGALVGRHAGRFSSMHVKNIAPHMPANYVGIQVPAPLGAGVIDWRTLLRVAVASGVRRFFVEQEAYETREPTLSDVAVSYRYLKNI